jgi:hypothetical protein
MSRVTTVTKRDLSRPVCDHPTVTTVTTPYGVSRYVTMIWAKAIMVPMPLFLSARGGAINARPTIRHPETKNLKMVVGNCSVVQKKNCVKMKHEIVTVAATNPRKAKCRWQAHDC